MVNIIKNMFDVH